MKILDVFKSKVSTLLNDNEQEINEKLIELVTFFYKIDKRISLEEQKFVDEFLSSIEWNSTISVESFHTDCISKINEIVSKPEAQISEYLSELMTKISDLNSAESAKVLAKEISDADGEIADDEVKYLEVVLSF